MAYYNTILTPIQTEILNGLLLSDGCIPNLRGRCKNYYFKFGNIHKEFVSDVKNILPFSWGPLQIRPEKYIAKNNGKIIHCKTFYDLYSHCDIEIYKYRQLWYVNNIKIIPKDLIITPLTMLYWFYGDGNSGYMNKGKGIRIRLATNSFSLDECEILCDKIQKTSNIKFYLEKTIKKDSYQIGICKNSSILNFYNFIGKCTLQCFDYKWIKL